MLSGLPGRGLHGKQTLDMGVVQTACKVFRYGRKVFQR